MPKFSSPNVQPAVQRRVLFVSDDLMETEVYAYGLRRNGVQADAVLIEEFSVETNLFVHCDLIVFELNAPQSEIPNQLHAAVSHFAGPLLFTTYEQDERFHLQVYQSGVDECIIKPIGLNLLFAKISAWLRLCGQTKAQHGGPPVWAEFALDPEDRLLRVPSGAYIKLTNLEYRLLHLFLTNPQKVLEADFLVERVWPEFGRGDATMLKNLVYRVRQKIEPDPHTPRYLHTVPGRGYMFSAV